MELSINCRNLSKNFKSAQKSPGFRGSISDLFNRQYVLKSAVKGFDLEVKRGEIIGLLGPNGAGKTTLMKMFTGIIIPSGGELKINGKVPWEREKEFRRKIALVMGQKSQLWWDIPAMDSFLLLQKYYEIPKIKFKNKVEYLAQILNVENLLRTHIRKLSLGERMKMELMASLLHSPSMIFLDEPTIGLDLVAQENIRHFLKDYHEKNNCTMVVTSHYMADVQALCSRLVLIMGGQKGFDGPIEYFEKILGAEKVVSFSFATPPKKNSPLWKRLDASWAEDGLQVELRIPESDLRATSLEIIEQFPVTDFHTEKLPIERVMKTLMENPEILWNQEQ